MKPAAFADRLRACFRQFPRDGLRFCRQIEISGQLIMPEPVMQGHVELLIQMVDMGLRQTGPEPRLINTPDKIHGFFRTIRAVRVMFGSLRGEGYLWRRKSPENPG